MDKGKKILAAILVVISILSAEGAAAFASSADTLFRGYPAANETAYGLSGNLLLNLLQNVYYGIKMSGDALSPDAGAFHSKESVSLSAAPKTAESSAETTAPGDTVSRGYKMIDGNVCNLYGNLLIPMHNGMTPDGYMLSPDFRVYGTQKKSDPVPAAQSTDFFSGAMALKLNVDGNQGRQVGPDFVMTEKEPNLVCSYGSGDPSGANFMVIDANHDTAVAFVPNVLPGYSTLKLSVYNSDMPNDHYIVKASAAGSAGASGNAFMKIVMQ